MDQPVDLTGCNLQYANLTSANFDGANLTNANLTGALFEGALNLAGATLDNLKGAILKAVDLRGGSQRC